jgi:hypothetical protein
MIARFNHMNLNVEVIAQNVQDVRFLLDTQPPIQFVDNAVISGLSANLDSECSMSRSYEDFILRNSDLHVELCTHFDLVHQMYNNGNLSSEALAEFLARLDVILEVQTTIIDLIDTNYLEHECRPRFN